MGENLESLSELNPDFFSVTYGAGGSTQSHTFDLVEYIQKRFDIPAMAHYTCVGSDKEKIKSDFDVLAERGITTLMALRGDPPKGETTFQTAPGGFSYASELISFAAEVSNFALGCAGYPEKHTEASNMTDDLVHLKEKLTAGATFIVTQMFFDTKHYFTYFDSLSKLGVNVPVIAGIMPLTHHRQLKRFAELSGTVFPEHIVTAFEAAKDDKEKMYEMGIELTVNMCKDLLDKGAPGLHLYTLNQSRATVDIFKKLKPFI